MRVTQTLEELQRARSDANVQAWLRLLRLGESSPDTDEAYRALFGWKPGNGKTFEDLSTHPRIALMSGWGWTSAAGAYQAMAVVPGKVKTDTWDGCAAWCQARRHTLTMQPDDQDLFAVWCTARRGALDLVLNGRIVEAMDACKLEWASLPGSTYGQPTKAADKLLAVYTRFGGTLNAPAPLVVHDGASLGSPADIGVPADAGAPTPEQPEAEPEHAPEEPPSGALPPTEWELNNPPQEKPMALPLIQALAGTLIQAFAPLAREKLEKEMARHTDRPEVAGQIAQTLVSAAQAATGRHDPVDAVSVARGNPDVMHTVQSTALDELAKLAPMLDRLAAMERQERQDIEASRDAAARRASAEGDMAPELLSKGFVIYMSVFGATILAIVLQIMLTNDNKPSGELVGLFIALATMGVKQWEKLYDYRFGSSQNNKAKDVVIERLSSKAAGR